jgi:hypothetical protein
MSNRRRDPRAWVEAKIQSNHIIYSLVQLRLVGLLLLLIVLVRVLVFLFAGLHLGPLEQLSSLSALANALPLLPLGISLYLLGAGRNRLRHEHVLMILLHHSLLPLALLVLLALPAAIVHQLAIGKQLAVAQLTFYQQELLSPLRNGTALVLSVVAGVGLLLLKRQADAEMARHRLNVMQFFQPYRAPVEVGSDVA